MQLRPLKRGRREPAERERAQKRSRGDVHQHPSAIHDAHVFVFCTDPGLETEVQAEASTCCAHRSPAVCCLTQSQCCACADVRPESNGYPLYIDGIGILDKGQRWQHYCPGCREFWEHQAKHHLNHRSHAIKITYRDQSFDIIRSDCPTVHDLKTLVARRVRCESQQLTFVASDVDWDLQVQPSMVHSTDAVAHARRIHFRCAKPDASIAEADTMEGVVYHRQDKSGPGFTLSDYARDLRQSMLETLQMSGREARLRSS